MGGLHMGRDSPLPPEWRCLTGRVQYVQRVSAKEFSSTCPRCGGEVHQNGEKPDRCRLFVDSHPTLYCRQCGLVAFPDQFGDERFAMPNKEEFEKRRRQFEEAELRRKRSAERALAYLRSSELWRQYHDQLNEHGRRYWERRGIPPSWQEFWGLGWNTDPSRWHSETATIPLFDQDQTLLNIKHRLIDTQDFAGKYRYEIAGQPQPLFLATAGAPRGHTIAVEGEIKAAVVTVTLDDADMTIVGLPGSNPAEHIVSQFSDCERVTLVFDPGAEVQAAKMVQAIGRKKCRVLIPPMKIDDGIIGAGLKARDVRALLSQAVGV